MHRINLILILFRTNSFPNVLSEIILLCCKKIINIFLKLFFYVLKIYY